MIPCTSFKNSNTILKLVLANIFCKEPDNKYFRLCGNRFLVSILIYFCLESKQGVSGSKADSNQCLGSLCPVLSLQAYVIQTKV